jgi:hypothetical protein
MVYFQTKSPSLGKFWAAFERTLLVYFMIMWSIVRSIWSILWTYGNFVYFPSLWYIVSRKIWQPCLVLLWEKPTRVSHGSSLMIKQWLKIPSLCYNKLVVAGTVVFQSNVLSSKPALTQITIVFLKHYFFKNVLPNIDFIHWLHTYVHICS